MNRQNRKIAFAAIFAAVFFLAALHGEGAKSVIDFILHAESGTGSVSRIIDELEIASSSAETPADKRSILVFLADVQEHAGRYADASQNYATAAGIAAPPASGMPRVSAEQLAINAVRCALFAGDYQTAEKYLSHPDVKNSADSTVQAYIKLYTAWSFLSKAAQTDGDLAGALALLEAYAKDVALEAVRPAVLFSLWFIDPTDTRRNALVTRYPNSPEAAVAQGKANILPSPFWYFLRSLASVGTKPNAPSGPLLQLGVFRVQSNAEMLINRLKEAGFTAAIITQKRDEQDYFVVTVVDYGDTLARLKAAGFEAFPLKKP